MAKRTQTTPNAPVDEASENPRKGLTSKHVDLDKVERRAKNALRKDVDHLCKLSGRAGGLSRDRAQALVNYMKLLRELKRSESAGAEAIPNEELERLAKEENS